MSSNLSVVCIGAGPAGLTAAYLLGKEGVAVTVLEQDPVYVGGISRTATYKDFAFDIGGHRFFSKSRDVERLWDEMLPDGFLTRPRKSRIYYRHRLFDYPLRAFDALSKLGVWEATRCVLSYVLVRLRPHRAPRNFQEWVTDKFGKRLFEIFFRTYTEKVWGMPCTEISADWAAQRIKGLSLSKAIWHSLIPQKTDGAREKIIKTLVGSFRYPRRGPGMLWEAVAARIGREGGEVLMGRRVTALGRRADGRWRVTARDRAGREQHFDCDHVISSMPMRDLVGVVAPVLPDAVSRAAAGLRYRDFLVVALVLKDRNIFDDNWIYIHDPDVKVGRIQNFKSWSPDMVPDPALNCYGLEYFCFEGDDLWNAPDDALVRLASAELVKLGLVTAGDIVDGTVVRQPKAYPVYDGEYQDQVATIRQALDAHCPNLHPVGRNGMHKYNNQDHAMMTAMLTVRNIMAGRRLYDVWQVNQDAEYHEEGQAGSRQTIDAGRHRTPAAREMAQATAGEA
ncbi:NAD(P)/FAD-dependent oxidoreductase [Gluconacetobacter diazotrophicus]|uniref:NAD(P)/FAD-dependent oxidoreductase n=2 Tax=Gluconacetobacter diazotrophicus TaxID=33996 RepID=A0A7W4FE67_GLUDI|nr:NAD(P)/FAD-dependent oxidoreductase [Gluconacetobacter diazotrophicus]MBB2156027.1 NAD(P)/FAD-dependent oxidoreductase [Gluconacetobacter diazotrophicus]TWB10404.1 protoporphyrinogen oxidase [Gluconacetobacter diazotrophicus]